MATQTQLNAMLTDPDRRAILRALMLFDSPSEEMFDRLTRLASRIVKAPVSLVSLVDDHRQWFKSSVGLPEPWNSRRETPLTHSFCQHVAATNEPLVVTDARSVDFLKDNLAIPDLNVIAYLGMPLTTKEGYGLGSFCVIDGSPRVWTEEEITILRDLAGVTISLIDLRAELIQQYEAAQERITTVSLEVAAARAEGERDANAVLTTVMGMLNTGQPHAAIRDAISRSKVYSGRAN